MKYIKKFEEVEFPIYKKDDYILIKNYKSNYIPGKIISIVYKKDYKLNIINLHNFIMLREDGTKGYYDNYTTHANLSIERKLNLEEIENFENKLLAIKFNI